MTPCLRRLLPIFFLLPLALTSCKDPYKETCDKNCQTCLAACYKECEASYKVCLGAASPFNRSSYENCPYYGKQCLQNCPEKCTSAQVKEGK